MTKEGYLKHKELIEAWVNGAKIEYYYENHGKWEEIENPSWCADIMYRIKPSKYELKGGNWFIYGDLVPIEYIGNARNEKTNQNGLERKTKEQAEDLSKLLKRTARLHALACELGGLKKFVEGENNYYILYDNGVHIYNYSNWSYEPSCVYMTKECAEKICEMLNNKEFDLEGEGRNDD